MVPVLVGWVYLDHGFQEGHLKPHMTHIAHTLARQTASKEAGNMVTSYRRYHEIATLALTRGVSRPDIIRELEAERARIDQDSRQGDAIYNHGIRNAKTSCQNAIALVIAELRGNE